MPKGVVHKPIGAGLGSLTYLGIKKKMGRTPTIPGLVIAGIGGYVMAGLPDRLEPAISPDHRSFFHSLVVAGVLVYIGYNVWKWMQSDQEGGGELGAILLSLIASYEGHLALDALTPRRLPVL